MTIGCVSNKGFSKQFNWMADQITAVAINKDKQSQSAVKWAVENLLSPKEPFLILLHVRVRNIATPGFSNSNIDAELSHNNSESDMKQLFMPYRGFCARKGVQTKEVVLDDEDIADAIQAYINNNCLNNIVVGATNRGIIQSWSKKIPPVSTTLTKFAPEFCSVYVIAKGKPLTVRKATDSPPSDGFRPLGLPSPKSESPQFSLDLGPNDDFVRRCAMNEGLNKRSTSTFRSPITSVSSDCIYTPKTPYSRDSNSVISGFSGTSYGLQSCDMSNSRELSNPSAASSATMIEAEMRRLKQELKKTMDMYNDACREAVMVDQNNQQFQKKLDEARKSENAKLAEEAVHKLAKMEKLKAQAAFDAAEASKRIAQLEAKRRKGVLTEAEAKDKVLTALANKDIQYRKYNMEEIIEATDNFADSLKIGEGGYGPVYKANLHNTNVAIKVLRSDATQGMKQFQQEVEVLSSMRHPNMVLLLGACPESGCLVYECMDNGSLEDRLFRKGGTPPIPWQTRFKIAAEVATGLLFLHQTKPEPLVHRDLKPANILIDHNYVSKISDVGLARLVPPSVADNMTQYHMTSAAGTFCYIDPEYQQTGMLGTKSDIYALGVVLLQIITAKPPMGLAHHIGKAIERGTFASFLDHTVSGWPLEETLSYAKLALKCAELRKRDRPDLETEILPELNRLRRLSQAESSGNGNFSSSPNTPISYSPRKPPQRSQERVLLRTDPNGRMPRKSRLAEMTSSSSGKSLGGVESPQSGHTGAESPNTSPNGEKVAMLCDLFAFEEDEETDEE